MSNLNFSQLADRLASYSFVRSVTIKREPHIQSLQANLKNGWELHASQGLPEDDIRGSITDNTYELLVVGPDGEAPVSREGGPQRGDVDPDEVFVAASALQENTVVGATQKQHSLPENAL